MSKEKEKELEQKLRQESNSNDKFSEKEEKVLGNPRSENKSLIGHFITGGLLVIFTLICNFFLWHITDSKYQAFQTKLAETQYVNQQKQYINEVYNDLISAIVNINSDYESLYNILCIKSNYQNVNGTINIYSLFNNYYPSYTKNIASLSIAYFKLSALPKQKFLSTSLIGQIREFEDYHNKFRVTLCKDKKDLDDNVKSDQRTWRLVRAINKERQQRLNALKMPT